MRNDEYLFYDTSVPGRWTNLQVPIHKLGAYAHIGRMDGWGISPDERLVKGEYNKDLNALVTVGTPFSGLCFENRGEEDRDRLMAQYACSALRTRDNEIYKSEGLNPRVQYSEADIAQLRQRNQDDIARRTRARAGAALWLFERDKRRCSFEVGEYTLSPTCRGYNSDAAEYDLTLDAPVSGLDVYARLVVHVLKNGVYQHTGWVSISVRKNGGPERQDGNLKKEPVLHEALVILAKRLAVAQQQGVVDRAQAKLDETKRLLGVSS